MKENIAVTSGNNSTISQQYQTGKPQDRPAREQRLEQTAVSQPTDTVTLSYSYEASATYSSSLTFQTGQNDGYDLLRGLVLNIFKEQGLSLSIPTGDPASGAEEISLEELTPEKAEELIADDGYFGVEQTSDRIVDFAIGIAGGDTARIDAIKEGIDKGFNEAKQAFGDWLPDISYATYDKVMEKLDAWVSATTAEQS